MKLYLVGSDYTLLNVTVYHEFYSIRNEESVLIVFGNISEKVKRNIDCYLKIFTYVQMYRHPKDMGLIEFIKNKRNIYELTKRFNSDVMQIISQNFAFTLILSMIIRRRSKLFLIEEGLSSYTDYNHDLKFRNKKLVILNTILPWMYLFPKIESILLYEPKMYLGKNRVIRLPAFQLDSNCLFNSLNNQTLPNLIFLGTPMSTLKNVLTAKLNSREIVEFGKLATLLRDNILEILFELSGSYKKHPSEMEIPQGVNLLCTNLPWELELESLSGNATLISYFSTALITPKLLYNKEPNVIFLYKMLEGYDFYKADEIVERLRDVYSKPQKVYVPHNMNDFKKFLYECV